MDALIQGDVLPLAWGVRISRPDGVVLRGCTTDLDETDRDFGLGWGVETYHAFLGPDVSTIEQTIDPRPDTMDVTGLLQQLGVTTADVQDGRYDGADVHLFYFKRRDKSVPAVAYSRFTIGGSNSLEASFKFELESLLAHLNQSPHVLETTGCGWIFMSAGCGVVRNPGVWQASTPYLKDNARSATLRDHVRPAVFNDRFFRVKENAGGTSGAGPGEPPWNLTLGGETPDGGVTWITERARLIPTLISAVIDRRTIQIDAATDLPDGFLVQGLVTALTGDNAWPRPLEVAEWTNDLVTRQIVLAQAPGRDWQVGDQLEVTLPCSRAMSAGNLNCQTYANQFRARLWQNKPGDNALLNPRVA